MEFRDPTEVSRLHEDGKIIEQEFNEARAKRITERVKQGYLMRNLKSAVSFADIDINGNGEVSAEEFAAHQLEYRQIEQSKDSTTTS